MAEAGFEIAHWPRLEAWASGAYRPDTRVYSGIGAAAKSANWIKSNAGHVD
jgi:hypothetical protein